MDLGHVSSIQFEKSCRSYHHYIERGLAYEVYDVRNPAVLCVTSGREGRIKHLAHAARKADLNIRFANLAELMEHGPLAKLWTASLGGGGLEALL